MYIRIIVRELYLLHRVVQWRAIVIQIEIHCIENEYVSKGQGMACM